jgi:hypothetical protein
MTSAGLPAILLLLLLSLANRLCLSQWLLLPLLLILLLAVLCA